VDKSKISSTIIKKESQLYVRLNKNIKTKLKLIKVNYMKSTNNSPNNTSLVLIGIFFYDVHESI